MFVVAVFATVFRCVKMSDRCGGRGLETQCDENPVGLAALALRATAQHGESGVVVQLVALAEFLDGFAPRVEVGAERGDLFVELVFGHLGLAIWCLWVVCGGNSVLHFSATYQ